MVANRRFTSDLLVSHPEAEIDKLGSVSTRWAGRACYLLVINRWWAGGKIVRYGMKTGAPARFGVAAIVGLAILAACSQAQPSTSASASPSDWVAHSAYGLQLSVPRTWSVQVFGQCPNGQKPGTLFIGTSRFVDYCPVVLSNRSQVAIAESASAIPTYAATSRHLRVHGLAVLSSKTESGVLWIIPSKQVTVTGSGPDALSIMGTLEPATPRAIPAAGIVSGTEYLEAVMQVPVSGSITITMPRSHRTLSVTAIDGRFSFSGAPGRYVLTGHDGNAPCPPVSVILPSGERVNAPPIRCQGV